jgi:hypothetical protein
MEGTEMIFEGSVLEGRYTVTEYSPVFDWMDIIDESVKEYFKKQQEARTIQFEDLWLANI